MGDDSSGLYPIGTDFHEMEFCPELETSKISAKFWHVALVFLGCVLVKVY